MRPELPSLITMCAILQSEETHKRVMGTKVNSLTPNTENYAHFSSVKSGDNSQGNKEKDKKGSKFFCDHCKRPEHIKDQCWMLYPHLKPTTAKGGALDANLAVTPDDHAMHNKFEQLSKQMEFLMSRCTSGKALAAGPQGEVSNSAHHTGKAFALSTSHFSIIVDSDAFDNMFAFSNLLTTFSSKSNYPHVTMENGSVVSTNGFGIAQLFSKEIKVIIVPELKANLLSISKCTNQMDCNVIFTPQKVIFQERASGRMIGERKIVHGLYVVQLDF
jgi:hypothetical protein